MVSIYVVVDVEIYGFLLDCYRDTPLWEEKYEFDWNKDIYMLEVSDSVYDRISNYNQIKLERNGKKINSRQLAFVSFYIRKRFNWHITKFKNKIIQCEIF